MGDSSYNSPARSVGEPASLPDSETEAEIWELVTEVQGSPDQTIIDGWLKFRDLKKVNCSNERIGCGKGNRRHPSGDKTVVLVLSHRAARIPFRPRIYEREIS
ncbi:hypothetical protein J6590_026473 [Homalodisca vitripennis]|nr:hypothetical protein J6590_026473 [Homalodisca vitripennis]